MPTTEKQRKTIIILAMHGSPPRDFPKHELMEYFELHSKFEVNLPGDDSSQKQRYEELDKKIHSWPRDRSNDPFHASSLDLAANIEELTGMEVLVGFNEFCNPTVETVLLEALTQSPEKIIVMTTMLMPGGEHAEKDIPEIIGRVKKQHPNTSIVYAWPFNLTDVAQFITNQIKNFN